MNSENIHSDADQPCSNAPEEGAERPGHFAAMQENLRSPEDRIRMLEQKLVEQAEQLTASNLAVQQNIEALKKSKQRLREREARLNSIFNAASEGIIMIDRKGIVVTANAAVKAILGYAEEELIGGNISLLMAPDHAVKHDRYIQNHIDTGISKIIGSVREVEGLHKGGWTVPLDLSLAKFFIDGEIFFTGLLRDIRQRKLQEKENREHLEELAHVTRLSLMGEMASGIAHEVNQPLTAIVAYTEVCVSLLMSPNPDHVKLAGILAKTNQQALRAGQIIHRMRDFVRSKTTSRTSASINQVVKDCIGLCSTEIKLQNILFCLELAENLPLVYINEVQIEQVLLNLLRNAIDAMHDLPVDRPRRLVLCTQLDDRQHIEITVKDSGPGISDADRAKIMTPFYTTKKNGMGMGLSISRSLVEAHHGTIRFNSQDGNGCTFYVTLPPKELVNEF
ncbi:PAS domain S-box protein [Methylomicrobium sp. Wu6]|uniref:two-component system sensor histidine kinase NtrB n=1 Tax=Methylomicrobium sp. Wu6 TaxID=3107928 RepID=UPI002DD6AC1E|nr:PAS domain S-box protein [Methylomicrobium sp. Wu6]MEC4747443.1 PAS domain S-box protein [Methylomicrobium sp. Wu6]